MFTTSESLMTFSLDRYYTPLGIAESVLKSEYSLESCTAIDTTCGEGNLLSAATNVFENVACVGIDKDRNAIRRLRKSRPEWLLSTADLLSEVSCKRALVLNSNFENGLLLLNPPFSHGATKSVPVSYAGHSFRASIAMSYILKSFELFSPKMGAMVIVPESMLYSETDDFSRKILQQFYDIKLLEEFSNTTFSGARVRSTAIKIFPKAEITNGDVSELQSKIALDGCCKLPVRYEVTRGTIPVYKMGDYREGPMLEFAHSTDIKNMVKNDFSGLEYVHASPGGRVCGNVILLPRVGIPKLENTKAIYLEREIQMSDCVIAIEFSSQRASRIAERHLKTHFETLEGIYRGTGARYTTIERLEKWLCGA